MTKQEDDEAKKAAAKLRQFRRDAADELIAPDLAAILMNKAAIIAEMLEDEGYNENGDPLTRN